MKHMNTLYYNNKNIEALTYKNIITIIVKTIKIIKLSRGKKIKNINKKENKKKTKIIITITLIMGENSIKEKNINNFSKRANKK